MPIEIKELVIRANARETNGANNDTDSAAPSMNATSTSAQPTEAQYQIIEECVRQILAILERKNER